MKHILQIAAISAALSLTAVASANAQQAQRVYESGTVWAISYIETKPGMFDDYMAYLNGPWKQIQEARKKAGDVVSYRVLANTSPRNGEADLMLMIEYKNMAVFDRSDDEVDKQTAAVFGSTVKANQAAVSRETLRTQRGAVLARELKFK